MNGCVIDGMPGDCETAVELVRAGGARMYFTYEPLPSSPFYVNHENGHGGYRRWVPADPHRDRGAHWEFATLEAFGGFGPVGVRDPQNTAPPADTRTDCQRFADRVAEIASKHNDVGGFVDDLARTFIGVASSDIDEMRQNANTHTGEYFSSSGFKEGLYDTLRDNQARHFMGGLIAGYKLGGVAGALVMNHNEDSQADLRVNKISIPLGASLTNPRSEEIVDRGDRGGWRRIPATPGFKALADAIRNQICDK